MAQYDAEHGTQYVTIVRELINNRFSLTAASAALYMHKSTLSYHMNRIRDHFHINFEDKLQILHLYQSFFIMDDFLHE
jgi:DNA-binding PucR family transcriptional regulator